MHRATENMYANNGYRIYGNVCRLRKSVNNAQRLCIIVCAAKVGNRIKKGYVPR